MFGTTQGVELVSVSLVYLNLEWTARNAACADVRAAFVCSIIVV